MAEYLARRGERKTVVVEERKIGEAVITKPGVAPPGVVPTAAVRLDVLKKAKDIVTRYGERGECISTDSLASDAGISTEEADVSLAAMAELDFGTKCCKTFFCSADACRNMMDKIHRWRGIA